MENRQQLLDNIWSGLKEMPRMQINSLLAQSGLAKNMYAKLEDADAKKLFLGLLTRLDDVALQEVVPLVQA